MLANKQTNKETIQQILEVINMDEESFKFKDNKSLFNKVSKKRDWEIEALTKQPKILKNNKLYIFSEILNVRFAALCHSN